ncbi:MAG: hypothetical protein GY950_29475 [bacterium]|nr:hypothetical protein [bacterium]
MIKKTIIILMFVLCLTASGLIYGAIPASERAALIALYNAAAGDDWTDNTGWKDGTLESDGFAAPGSEGNWYGIGVYEDHVISVGLSRNNLVGTLPAELGNLVQTYWLAVDQNQLTGSIPPGLGNLSEMQYLSISYNELTGSIPPELGNLSVLMYIRAQYNQLTGSIPPELGNLDNLKHLFLHNNQLSGTIPGELGNMDKLKNLYLQDNGLTGSIPAGLGNFSGLETLYLQNNELSGGIPPELGNLSNLHSLSLAGNQLIGAIPVSIGNLLNLGRLDMGYNGLYNDNAVFQQFLDEKDPDWEATQTVAPADVSAAAVSSSSVTVSWTPVAYSGDTGGYLVYYGAASGGPWTYAGKTSDKSTASYTVTGLLQGRTYYFVVKTRTDAHGNNPNTVESEYSAEASAETSTIPPGQDQAPFGAMELPPAGGGPVSGSIAVSGWALDDVKVTAVKIYNGTGSSRGYIGDAVLVEGARPDVELAYPQYPNNRKAGWGYMLLTNFLPNGGSGSTTLQAVALDYLGHETVLGTRTIVWDNINAVNPIGAIDTPGQGGTAQGTAYRNNGWVLAAVANSIPADGSTINVYVDGMDLGNPTYGIYREDIYGLFYGYANRDGAGAYLDLDTTAYDNGVHTIYWTATDGAGNTEGIGSRYFTIDNAGIREQSTPLPLLTAAGASGPARVLRGYGKAEEQMVCPDYNGNIKIGSRPMERVVIGLENMALRRGYLAVNGQLRSLPTGSTLDRETGIFYWQPGPGFMGTFRFVFVAEGPGNEKYRVDMTVNIVPVR